jgi:hypothetical protein
MSNLKISKSQVLIRDATEKDVGFIFNSWLKSYKASAFAKYISGPVYYNLHHKSIETILKRSRVLVAANPVDPNQIYGYLCLEQQQETTVVHFAYTKEAFRKMGILQLLLNEAQVPEIFFYSHSTLSASQVLPKIARKGVYNPYLAFIGLVA